MIAPPHRSVANSKSSAPQLKSRRITAARPFIGLLLVCAARQAHAVSSPAVPDRAPVSDATSVGRALSEAACTNLDDGATDSEGDGCSGYYREWCGTSDDTDFSSNKMCCVCGGGLAQPSQPPLPPQRPPSPALPPRPPAAPTAIGDSKFGCGYPGPHLAEPKTAEALNTAVGNAGRVTCIKLAPITYALTSTLVVYGTVAIVAEEGQATLDGGGSMQHMYADYGADVALANLVLRNGYSQENGGAIFNDGIMALETCVFVNNKAESVRLRRPS